MMIFGNIPENGKNSVVPKQCFMELRNSSYEFPGNL
jgi:hypothetical protein